MKGKRVSEDLAWAIVRMAPLIGYDEIEAFTGISKRQIRSILSLWRNTGNVTRWKDNRIKGRPRHLTPQDVAVCNYCSFCASSALICSQFIQGAVNKNCDTYLDELQESLQDTCAVEASLPTIWRALKRSGYTMKKVRSVCTTVRSHPMCGLSLAYKNGH